MESWENLNQLVQREVITERDVFFYALMKNIGVQKGKSFDPRPEKRIFSSKLSV
jgi:hypothetical protein